MTKEVQKIVIPKYEDLVNMEVVKAAENDFQVLLNQNPPAAWVQTNKLANGSLYIPIDKVERFTYKTFINLFYQNTLN